MGESSKLHKKEAKGWLILAGNQSCCEMTFSHLQPLRSGLGATDLKFSRLCQLGEDTDCNRAWKSLSISSIDFLYPALRSRMTASGLGGVSQLAF